MKKRGLTEDVRKLSKVGSSAVVHAWSFLGRLLQLLTRISTSGGRSQPTEGPDVEGVEARPAILYGPDICRTQDFSVQVLPVLRFRCGVYAGVCV